MAMRQPLSEGVIPNAGVTSIDGIEIILARFGVEMVEGDIIFPSQRVEGPMDVYAAKLGLTLLNHRVQSASSPSIYPMPHGDPDQYSVIFPSLTSFSDVLVLFDVHRQLPPYYLKGSSLNFPGILLQFGALEAELNGGKIQHYKYTRYYQHILDRLRESMMKAK